MVTTQHLASPIAGRRLEGATTPSTGGKIGSSREMIFVGIVTFILVTLGVTGLLLKGNGDSPSNYF